MKKVALIGGFLLLIAIFFVSRPGTDPEMFESLENAMRTGQNQDFKEIEKVLLLYKEANGEFPASLELIKEFSSNQSTKYREDLVDKDLWGRDLIYEFSSDSVKVKSLGQKLEDPSDDLSLQITK